MNLNLPGFTYLGLTLDGTLHVFASLMSWDVKVCGAFSGKWSSNTDPDFPRYMIDGDLLHDLEENRTYTIAPVCI